LIYSVSMTYALDAVESQVLLRTSKFLWSPLAYSVIGQGGVLDTLERGLAKGGSIEGGVNEAYLRGISNQVDDEALVRSYFPCAQRLLPVTPEQCERKQELLMHGEVGRLAALGTQLGESDGVEPAILSCTMAVCLELSLTCQYTGFFADPAVNFATLCDLAEVGKKAFSTFQRLRNVARPVPEELEGLTQRVYTDDDTLENLELPTSGLGECTGVATAIKTTGQMCSAGEVFREVGASAWVEIDDVLAAARFSNKQVNAALPSLKRTLFYFRLAIGSWWPFVRDGSEWQYIGPPDEDTMASVHFSELPHLVVQATERVHDLKEDHRGFWTGNILLLVTGVLALYSLRQSTRTVRERMLLLKLAHELYLEQQESGIF